ncbi:MAG: hypothetical protein ACLFVT_01475 [Syntrophobacteria bacterium]
MSAWRKQSVVFLLVATLLLTVAPSSALAEGQKSVTDSSGEAMIFDFLFLRPLGVAATAVGSSFFVATLPFSALGKNTGEAARKMMVEPAKFTFTRPLGQLD